MTDQMEIPNIPTDNLYKFKAISGIALIIFILTSILYLQKDKYSNLIEIAKESDFYKIDSLRTSDSIYYYNAILAIEKISFLQKYNIQYDSISKRKPILNQPSIDKVERILLIEQKIKELKNKIVLKKTQINVKSKTENSKELLLKIIYVFLFALLIFGIFLSSSGFYQWYNRTQKYYDKKLKKEALIEFQYVVKSDALRVLYEIYYKTLPVKTHEEQDWDDARSIISSRFPDIQTDLETFRKTYSSVLTDEINEILTESINICGSYASYDDKELNNQATVIYNNFLELLGKIKKVLRDEIK